MLISTEEKCHIECLSERALGRFFWCLFSWRCKRCWMRFENSQASHCTGNQLESHASQATGASKIQPGRTGVLWEAVLLEHFMSTCLCCLQDRCLKRWGWTGADVMSLWNSITCRNHPAGLYQKLKVVLTYPTGKQLPAQGEANPWLGF